MALIGSVVMIYASQPDRDLAPSEPEDMPLAAEDRSDAGNAADNGVAYFIPDVEVGALEANRALRDVTPDGVTPSPPINWPAERAPSVEPPEPRVPEPEPARFFRVGVIDAGTIQTQRDYTVEFAHIEAIDADRSCIDEDGAEWPCGSVARHQLMRLIRNRAVICDIAPEDLASLVEAEIQVRAVCSVGGFEINAWLVEQGWATAQEVADARYTNAEQSARENGRGQWTAVWPAR